MAEHYYSIVGSHQKWHRQGVKMGRESYCSGIMWFAPRPLDEVRLQEIQAQMYGNPGMRCGCQVRSRVSLRSDSLPRHTIIVQVLVL